MSGLPNIGWVTYASPPDAIGAERTFNSGDDEGLFTFANSYEMADFLTDVVNGTSIYSTRFTSADVISFISSVWYAHFINRWMGDKGHNVEYSREQHWECRDGDDPQTILFVGTERAVGLIHRLRPVDILDIFIRTPCVLDALFPEVDNFIGKSLGGQSRVYLNKAACTDCGREFEGRATLYEAVKVEARFLTDDVSPLVLSLIAPAFHREKSYEVLTKLHRSGISLFAFIRYCSVFGLNGNSLADLDYLHPSLLDSILKRAVFSRNVLVVARLVDWFPDVDKGAVSDLLAEFIELVGIERIMAVVEAQREAGNRDTKILRSALEEDIDVSVLAIILD